MWPAALRRAWIFFWAPDRHVTCGDMVFSGHTTFLMTCAMVFKRYCKSKWMKTKVVFRSSHTPEAVCKAIRGLVYAYVALGAVLIIGTRLHYTLDVVIALGVTYQVFSQYHSYLRYKRLKEKGWWFLRWFEAEEIMTIESWAYERAKQMD